jgi:hypothetical protein
VKLEEILQKHIEEDRLNFQEIKDKFDAQENYHKSFDEKLTSICANVKKSNEFMENLSEINNFVKGASLLKKPMIWFLAFVVGLVALMGGLKTITSWFIIK